MAAAMLSNFASWNVMDAVMLFMYYLNSYNMDWIVLAKSVYVIEYEAEEVISSVLVSVEFGRPDSVFVEGDMRRNKYWLGL